MSHDIEVLIEGEIDTDGTLAVDGDFSLDIGIDVSPSLASSLVGQAGPAVIGTLLNGFGKKEEPKPCGEYHPLPCGVDKDCPETGSEGTNVEVE